MMINEDDISLALCNAIEAAVGASSIPAMPVQMPLRTFSPPADDKWVEVIQFRNNPSNEYWGEERSYRGVVNVLLHWSNNDGGSIVPTAYLREIGAALSKGSIFREGTAAVKITDNPNMGSMIVDNGKIMFPMSLPYRDFQTG